MSARRFSAVTLTLALVGAMIAAVEEATCADTPASITTPNGSPVHDTWYLDEMSAEDIARANANAAAAAEKERDS